MPTILVHLTIHIITFLTRTSTDGVVIESHDRLKVPSYDSLKHCHCNINEMHVQCIKDLPLTAKYYDIVSNTSTNATRNHLKKTVSDTMYPFFLFFPFTVFTNRFASAAFRSALLMSGALIPSSAFFSIKFSVIWVMLLF